MHERVSPRTAGLMWLLASALFVIAALTQPGRRASSLALAVVFGIIGASAARRATKTKRPTDSEAPNGRRSA